MNDEKQPGKVFSRDVLKNQVEQSKKFITGARQQIAQLQREIERQTGILGYSEHLLSQFEISPGSDEPEKVK